MSPHKTPICRIYPLQFRKIWKKLLALEIGRGGTEARKMWRPIVNALLLLTVVSLVFLYWGDQNGAEVKWSAIIGLIIALWAMLYTLLAFYLWLYIWTYYYDFDEHYMRVRKGVLIRREVTIPYQRIHDVYIDQDLLDHVFRLYDLYVATASEKSLQETHIDGLSYDNAQKLRDLLLHEVRESHHAHRDIPYPKLDKPKKP